MVQQCRTCHYGRGRSGHGETPDGMRCFLNPPTRIQLPIVEKPEDKFVRGGKVGASSGRRSGYV